MRHLFLVLALILGGAVSSWAQGTVVPPPQSCWYDSNGDPLGGGTLRFDAAGTTTLVTVYTDQALTTAATNPVTLNGSGCTTIFLAPSTYKVTLKNSAGTQIWSVDGVSALAPFNVDLDITGRAGEALAANDVVFLSDGSGGRTAGRWYKTDADTAAMSLTAHQIGVAKAAIASSVEGSIRVLGRVTGLSGLVAGTSYYVSGTAGALISTAPANRRFVGVADSTTTLVLASAQYEPASPTLDTLTLSNTGASALDVGGGINAGTGNVALVDATGKITKLSATEVGATTSAQLAGVLSNETGTDAFVLQTSPSLTTPTIAGGVLSGTFSGGPTFSGAVIFNAIHRTGLRVADTDDSHALTITPGSNLTVARTFTLTTGDADRTLTLNGNPALDDWFDQSVKTTAAVTFATVNTGHGANELYAMNQAVRTTDNPTFAALTVTSMNTFTFNQSVANGASPNFTGGNFTEIPTSAISSGTFADARIAASNVTQHQAALTIAETQITDGALLARVAGTETISGPWTFSGIPIFSASGQAAKFNNGSMLDFVPAAGNNARIYIASTESSLRVKGGSDGVLFRNNTDSSTIASLTDAGILTVSGSAGIHEFTGTGNGGEQILRVRNTAAGTANRAIFMLGNDNNATGARIEFQASNLTTSGFRRASQLAIAADDVGGIGIAATNGAGVIRLSTAGTEWASLSATGIFAVASSIRSTGESATGLSGGGAEVTWDGSQSTFRSYNRSTSTYQPMSIQGSTVSLNTSTTGAITLGGVVSNQQRYNSASAQPGFLAYNSANDTGVTSGVTVDFDTEVYDEAGNFAADVFTAPVTGRYLLCATVMPIADSGSGTILIIRIDTSNRSYEFFDTAASNSRGEVGGCVHADMDASDTASVTNFSAGTVTITGNATVNTFFSGRLLP